MSASVTPVEVVVPGAPSHLVRRRGAGLLGRTDVGGPAGPAAPPDRARPDHDGVQRASGAGSSTTPPRVASARTWTPSAVVRRRIGAVMVAPADEADEGELAIVVPQDRDLLGAQVAGAAGSRSAWCMSRRKGRVSTTEGSVSRPNAAESVTDHDW